MASNNMHHKKLRTLLSLLFIQMALAKSIKGNARPVHEIINEQSKLDQEKSKTTNLPYSNPLAGNSKQNARQHALHQQAMFNAERSRQHRAQLQRWTSAPQQMDSYMKAYHESQENHHLALEKQQSTAKEAREQKNKDAPFTPSTTSGQKQKPVHQRTDQKRTSLDSVRSIKDVRYRQQEKSRNHRSYGSADYYSQPIKYKTVYFTPNQGYEQGVTIKPNSNLGISEEHTSSEEKETPKLYTHAVPSATQYVYPKQYQQMQHYQSAQDIASLSSLLKKAPHDQLSELNALIHPSKEHTEEQHSLNPSIQQPIDLYFYLKDSPVQSLPEHYNQIKYAQIPHNYAHAELVPVDHKPITEDVDDIADPNKPNKLTSYGVQTIQSQSELETTTTKSNNYYKVEVASQTISAGYKSPHQTVVKQPEYVLQHQTSDDGSLAYHHQSAEDGSLAYQSQTVEDDGHAYQDEASHYGQQQLYYYPEHSKETEDQSEQYLHHNAQQTGIQHLTGDGTEVSAYGDQPENLHYAANYEFGYRVRDQHTGNDFGHQEAKNGEKTKGNYHVLLPDGRLQKVKYWAGPSGFHADISYDHLQEHTHE